MRRKAGGHQVLYPVEEETEEGVDEEGGEAKEVAGDLRPGKSRRRLPECVFDLAPGVPLIRWWSLSTIRRIHCGIYN